MRLVAVFIWPLMLLLALPAAWADARLSVLVDVLRLDEAAQILSQEGIAFSDELDRDMLDGQGGAAWRTQVTNIYDAQRMTETLREALATGLQGEALEQAITFYASDLGSDIVRFENTARVIIADPEAEAAAREQFVARMARDDPRIEVIGRLISSGDMVTRNVTNEMNAQFQFLRGLSDGDALDMSEAEMLRDASEDVDAKTEETRLWLNSYLLMAYAPLSDEQLETYVQFSQSTAGKALNRALFTGFANAYEEIFYALGRAVALNMRARDL
ncbi:MAG: hypothetical protein AAF755_11970 [Pseudomonadota bacterium]